VLDVTGLIGLVVGLLDGAEVQDVDNGSFFLFFFGIAPVDLLGADCRSAEGFLSVCWGKLVIVEDDVDPVETTAVVDILVFLRSSSSLLPIEELIPGTTDASAVDFILLATPGCFVCAKLLIGAEGSIHFSLFS
jgi:hypothetical protein